MLKLNLLMGSTNKHVLINLAKYIKFSLDIGKSIQIVTIVVSIYTYIVCIVCRCMYVQVYTNNHSVLFFLMICKQQYPLGQSAAR